MAGLARALGIAVTVVDDRPEYASRERFPEADKVVAAPIGDALGWLPIAPGTAIVVAMRSHDLDYEATAAALRTPAGYVGLLGARRKAVMFTERLVAEGIPIDRIRALRAPIGLDIGARAPAEIAVSILAEWLMVRQGGSGSRAPPRRAALREGRRARRVHLDPAAPRCLALSRWRCRFRSAIDSPS